MFSSHVFVKQWLRAREQDTICIKDSEDMLFKIVTVASDVNLN